MKLNQEKIQLLSSETIVTNIIRPNSIISQKMTKKHNIIQPEKCNFFDNQLTNQIRFDVNYYHNNSL